MKAELRRGIAEREKELKQMKAALAAFDGGTEQPRRVLSKAAREKIADAQRKRWAKVKAAKG